MASASTKSNISNWPFRGSLSRGGKFTREPEGDNRSRCPLGYKACEHRKIESSLILSSGVHRPYSQVDIGYDCHNEGSGNGLWVCMEDTSGGVRLWVRVTLQK